MSTISACQVWLYCNAHLTDVKVHRFSIGEVALFIGPSIDEGELRVNQDSLALVELPDQSLVLAVADGAGGHRGGAEASEVAIKAFVGSLSEHEYTPEGYLKGALLHAIDKANEAVISLGIGAASTFIVVHINERGVRSFHVGDSQALVVGQQGKLKLQTLSHSPVSYAVESGMLDEEAAMTHEQRSIVSNLLGLEDMHIQISARSGLSARDSLVVASDGLFDNLRQEEIADLMRRGRLGEALSELISLSHHRMLNPEENHPSKFDDISAILFRPERKSQ